MDKRIVIIINKILNSMQIKTMEDVMQRVIMAILLGMVLYPLCSAQQKMYGYKYSGEGDILSDCFIIQNGFVLDSVVSVDGNKTYSFEYNEQGKLKRDINFYRFDTLVTQNGRPIFIQEPGSRDYYYAVGGDIDSVGYGHWTNNGWVNDFSGFKYHYSSNGKITSIIYSAKDSVTRVDENSYNSTGNLILNKVIISGDTTFNSREYDSLNRVTLRKIYYSENSSYYPYIIQSIYQYDSSGNINCTKLNISRSDTSDWNYSFKFDSTGKAVDEIFDRPSDTLDIAFNYDGSGRILKMGTAAWYHYNTDGNLDSLAYTHIVYSGYLGGRATLFDSYGNTISLSETFGGGGVFKFYYSQKVTGVKTNTIISKTFTLCQNYPNPFNPSTSIQFELSRASTVHLKILNVLGQEIAAILDDHLAAGTHTVQWNAQACASGIYFYHLQAGGVSSTMKMLLMK
jgi:hypothetical protein